MYSQKDIEGATNEIMSVLGKEKTMTDDFIRYSYSKDGTCCYADISTPALITLPESTEEVQKIVLIANKYKVPVVAVGSRTSCWQGYDSKGGIVIDTSKMRKIIEIDERNLTFTVQSGASVNYVDKVLRKRGLCYPTHPMNYSALSYGAEVVKDSGGETGGMYGHVAKRIVGLEVVLGNGDILVTGSSRVIKNTPYFQQSGIPDLTQLFVASEGAYGIITEVTMEMQAAPTIQGGCDFKFEGSMNGMKNLMEACQELRLKRVHSNAHGIDFYCLWEMARGVAAKQGIEVTEEAIRQQFGHALLVEIDSFLSQEDYDLKKKAVIDICQKHGGTYTGDELTTKAMLPETRGEPGYKQLYAESSPTITFWADAAYDDVPILYEKYLEICDQNDYPKKRTAFVIAVGDDGCEAYFFTFPDTLNEEDVKKGKLIMDKTMEMYTEVGVIPYRIGRLWRPYILDKLDPRYRKYIMSLKKQFDPNNIMNPGVSVFEEEYT